MLFVNIEFSEGYIETSAGDTNKVVATPVHTPYYETLSIICKQGNITCTYIIFSVNIVVISSLDYVAGLVFTYWLSVSL